MKTYTITVNGKTYEVTVEEKAADSASPSAAEAKPAQQAAAAKAAAGSQASASQPVQGAQASFAQGTKPSSASAGTGAISIEAGAAGKIVDILAEPGTAVSRGDTVLILEVMKMETPVVAPADGTIATIETAKGDHVAAGAVLATME